MGSEIQESGKPKARLVIVGYHDPRVGSDVRTEASVASRRGRSLFFMATAHNQFSIEKGDVKNAFFQGTFDDKTHGELAAEPVPELRKALNLREDEVVVLESVLCTDFVTPSLPSSPPPRGGRATGFRCGEGGRLWLFRHKRHLLPCEGFDASTRRCATRSASSSAVVWGVEGERQEVRQASHRQSFRKGNFKMRRESTSETFACDIVHHHDLCELQHNAGSEIARTWKATEHMQGHACDDLLREQVLMFTEAFNEAKRFNRSVDGGEDPPTSLVGGAPTGALGRVRRRERWVRGEWAPSSW